jgi:lipopolysaccharide/colanic/teichoic acid biosynthesis glycosyltransferase
MMTRWYRWVQPVVAVAIVLFARWIHLEYRAPEGGSDPIGWYLGLAAIFAIVAAVVDAPRTTNHSSTAIVAAGSATLLATGVAATIKLALPDLVARFVVIASAAMFFVWLAVVGLLMALRARHAGRSDRVVAVLSDVDATALAHEVDVMKSARPFNVVATITSTDDYSTVAAVCERTNANVLVLGPQAIIAPEVIEQAEPLHRAGVRVRSQEMFYDQRLGKLPLSSLEGFALLGDIETLHGGYAPLKRAIDLVLASIGLLALALMIPFVTLGNLIGNRGPLLFRQPRAGRFGEPFDILKLRTMVPGAVDVSGWTSNNDPRITGFGAILRRTHIDELPQVFNIFRGELSVVGPRPEQISYVRQLETALPFYAARHLVLPGLTGWAQVRYPYAASEEDAFVKLQFDLHYVRHESLTTDLRIIWLTLRHVLFDGGR